MTYCPDPGQKGEASAIDPGAALPHTTLGLSSCLEDPCVLQLSDQISSAKELIILHSHTNVLILPLICIVKAVFLFFWVQLLFACWHFRLHLAGRGYLEENWDQRGRRVSWFGRAPSLPLENFWTWDSKAAGRAGFGLSGLLHTRAAVNSNCGCCRPVLKVQRVRTDCRAATWLASCHTPHSEWLASLHLSSISFNVLFREISPDHPAYVGPSGWFSVMAAVFLHCIFHSL